MSRVRLCAIPAFLVLLVLYWFALKRGWVPPNPSVFAAMVALFMAALLAEGGRLLRAMVRDARGRVRRAAGLAMVAGLLAACAGGMANWLLSLQGIVILNEGEALPLQATGHLVELEAGWLADPCEMGLVLRLDELTFLPEAGGFFPESHLAVSRGGAAWESLAVSSKSATRWDRFWFQQGAFGFAPHIVILREGKTVFDRFVPFTTRRQGPRGVVFEGEFILESEDLSVAGNVSLDSLDERMRGHSTLGLHVAKEGRSLGAGDLLPGHFADLEDGYRIGFAGLKKWSEIDISRKNYPLPIFIGLGMMLLGGLLWPIAVWRKW